MLQFEIGLCPAYAATITIFFNTYFLFLYKGEMANNSINSTQPLSPPYLSHIGDVSDDTPLIKSSNNCDRGGRLDRIIYNRYWSVQGVSSGNKGYCYLILRDKGCPFSTINETFWGNNSMREIVQYVSLSPDPNTIHWFLKLRFLSGVSYLTFVGSHQPFSRLLMTYMTNVKSYYMFRRRDGGKANVCCYY